MEAGQHTVRQSPEHIWAATKRPLKHCAFLPLPKIRGCERPEEFLSTSHIQSHPDSFLFCPSVPPVSRGYRLGDRVGLGSVEPAAVTSISACSLMWHRIRSCMKRKHMTGRGQLCCWAPQEWWPGGTLHTMPLHVCLPCQQCDPVTCPRGVRGKGGNVLHFTETASWDTPREASFT